MKEIGYFNPKTFSPFTGADKDEQKDINAWFLKHMEGFTKTHDFNTEMGIKELWQKGKEIKLVKHCFGNMSIFEVTEKEKEEMIADSDVWEEEENGVTVTKELLEKGY